MRASIVLFVATSAVAGPGRLDRGGTRRRNGRQDAARFDSAHGSASRRRRRETAGGGAVHARSRRSARAWIPESPPRRMRHVVRGAAVGAIRPRRHSPATRRRRSTSYYCGPAAVHEALNSVGVGMSQQTAADHLNTTTAGTAWSGGGTSPSGYPVPDVLNHHETRNYYVPQSVSSDGSSAVDQYEQDLTYDIYAVGAPAVGNAYEIPGGAPPQRASEGQPDTPLVRHPWVYGLRGLDDV